MKEEERHINLSMRSSPRVWYNDVQLWQQGTFFLSLEVLCKHCHFKGASQVGRMSQAVGEWTKASTHITNTGQAVNQGLMRAGKQTDNRRRLWSTRRHTWSDGSTVARRKPHKNWHTMTASCTTKLIYAYTVCLFPFSLLEPKQNTSTKIMSWPQTKWRIKKLLKKKKKKERKKECSKKINV